MLNLLGKANTILDFYYFSYCWAEQGVVLDSFV